MQNASVCENNSNFEPYGNAGFSDIMCNALHNLHLGLFRRKRVHPMHRTNLLVDQDSPEFGMAME